jgi:hypothetical protein
MPSIDDLDWIESRTEVIPTGAPGETLWVQLGWAAYEWVWHDAAGLWGPDNWRDGSNAETVRPGDSRGDMSWARPVGEADG